jgi:hypothetical protein
MDLANYCFKFWTRKLLTCSTSVPYPCHSFLWIWESGKRPPLPKDSWCLVTKYVKLFWPGELFLFFFKITNLLLHLIRCIYCLNFWNCFSRLLLNFLQRLKPYRDVQTRTAIYRIFAVAFYTRPSFLLTDFLVAIKQGSTAPLDFVWIFMN